MSAPHFAELALGGPLARLKARLAEVSAKLPDFPRARYALWEDDGTVKFYVVDRPQKGKWQGSTFVKAQASDDTWPIRNVSARLSVLERIAEDWQAAMILYTEEIGKCGCCGRTLTQKTSLALGIGPVCAQKMGITA